MQVILTHSWLPMAALTAFVALGPVAARRLAGRPRAAWTAFGVALVPVAFLTLVPTGGDAEACVVTWQLPTPGNVEMVSNIALFVPPALLAVAASRRPWLVLAGGVLGSVTIELLQTLLPALGRSCDTNDVLANTIGAAIGVALATLALRRARRTTATEPQRSSEVEAPLSR
ncbi:VanZ family protein [Cellulosimicrobium sp. CUA-896]|uniref:VanZ family protein n=1 Tax=Cellulosimicrobium sp. CUA-896 TaxID=1517881 RepID=UPI0011153F82|nr:VanZ family protein [Cellulosimicrobium sp. CUA-896]